MDVERYVTFVHQLHKPHEAEYRTKYYIDGTISRCNIDRKNMYGKYSIYVKGTRHDTKERFEGFVGSKENLARRVYMAEATSIYPDCDPYYMQDGEFDNKTFEGTVCVTEVKYRDFEKPCRFVEAIRIQRNTIQEELTDRYIYMLLFADDNDDTRGIYVGQTPVALDEGKLYCNPDFLTAMELKGITQSKPLLYRKLTNAPYGRALAVEDDVVQKYANMHENKSVFVTGGSVAKNNSGYFCGRTAGFHTMNLW